MSTSGRLHGEFLRFLYITAYRRTTNCFRQHSNDEPSDDAFKFRRGQHFWHTHMQTASGCGAIEWPTGVRKV